MPVVEHEEHMAFQRAVDSVSNKIDLLDQKVDGIKNDSRWRSHRGYGIEGNPHGSQSVGISNSRRMGSDHVFRFQR